MIRCIYKYYITAMPKEENPETKIDLRRYHSRGGINLQRANIGLWLAENRQRIAKITTICLIIISAALFIYSSYNYVIYFMTEDPDMVGSESNVVSPRNMTVNLELGAAQILASGDKYDLAIKLHNPNEKFSASFNYCWRYQGVDLDCGNGFIFPQEEKYIVRLGQVGELTVSDSSFNITGVFWQRIDSKKIPNWSVFAANRINLLISDKNFLSAEQSGLSNNLNLNSLSFSIKNQSAFSYYDLPLNILLFDAYDNLVAVHRYSLMNFLSGEQRKINLSLIGRLGKVVRIEVMPDINILDDSVYLKYQGETSQ